MNRIQTILADQTQMSKIKQGAYIVFLLFVVVVSFSASGKKSNKAVEDLIVRIEPLSNGHMLIDTSDVYDLVEGGFGSRLIGKQVGSIDEAKLERIISDFPFVKSAEVYINAHEELHINIIQRQPLLRVLADNGLNYYMDVGGVRIPLSNHITERLVVFTGNIPPHVPDFKEAGPALLQDVFAFGQLIHADPFFNSLIEQVDVQGKEFVLIPKLGRQKIKFGGMDDAEGKLERLKKFYQEVLGTEGYKKYKIIDVRFDKQVVCEKR